MHRPTASKMGSLRGSLVVVEWFMADTRKPKRQSQPDGDERSPQETERIREAALKRILSTPPKRHADMIAERKAKRGGKVKR